MHTNRMQVSDSLSLSLSLSLSCSAYMYRCIYMYVGNSKEQICPSVCVTIDRRGNGRRKITFKNK
jgi:hypothetical protein